MIRGNPWLIFLRCAAGKGQQGDIAGLLDRRRQAPLVRRAHAGQATGHDLDAELAHFLATEILAATFASTGASRATGTGWTALAAIRTIA
jgi:hypothetical protein